MIHKNAYQKKTAASFNNTAIGNCLLLVSGIFIFAYFIGSPGIYHWVALGALLLPVIAIARHVILFGEAGKIWGVKNNRRRLYPTMPLALVVGIGFGCWYRFDIGMPLWAVAIMPFTFTAMAIGATEELLFRGVLFYMVPAKHSWITILVCSLAHAGYKTSLFLSPYAQFSIDTWAVFNYTFIAGILLGSMRAYAQSVAPPLLAHVAWDAVVYADSATAPWWIW